ncbi:MAG: tetratricopeptide repeat protein [Bowdeniella nasicola]|nr:tetratricopeptide repeat protein [Bowdeniella nasicola]
MTNPSYNAHGAIDLGQFGATPAGQEGTAPAGAPSTGDPSGSTEASATPAAPGATVPGPYVIDAGDADFAQLAERSAQVPIVVDLWASWCQPCRQLTPILEKLAAAYEGAFQLAKIDIDANPQVTQAFQVQSVPTVYVLIGGQPFQLFQGAHPESQLRQLFDQMLQIAAQQGVTGRMSGEGESPAAEPELPPLHREGMEAIERGDLQAAHEAFTKAIKQAPADAEAKLALTQVELLQRTEAIKDPAAALRAAGSATAPEGDIEVQLRAADLEFAGGQAREALTRLLTAVRTSAGEDREAARARMVDFFDLLGTGEPMVADFRRQLASALY